MPLYDSSVNNALVRLENVTKSYLEGGQTRSVLQGVSAEFLEGQFSAIRGRSGSGKSTLLNLIAGIDSPTGGDITTAEWWPPRLRPARHWRHVTARLGPPPGRQDAHHGHPQPPNCQPR